MCHTHPSNIISCDKNEMLTLKSIDVPYVLDTSINFSTIQLIVVAVDLFHTTPTTRTNDTQSNAAYRSIDFVFAFYLLPSIKQSNLKFLNTYHFGIVYLFSVLAHATVAVSLCRILRSPSLNVRVCRVLHAPLPQHL